MPKTLETHIETMKMASDCWPILRMAFSPSRQGAVKARPSGGISRRPPGPQADAAPATRT